MNQEFTTAIQIEDKLPYGAALLASSSQATLWRHALAIR
jgi:hypothetical protein